MHRSFSLTIQEINLQYSSEPVARQDVDEQQRSSVARVDVVGCLCGGLPLVVALMRDAAHLPETDELDWGESSRNLLVIPTDRRLSGVLKGGCVPHDSVDRHALL